MENLLTVTLTSLLIGVPVIVAEHYAMRVLWPENYVLVRYVLGCLAIALALGAAWALTGRAGLLLELAIALLATGGATAGCHWLDEYLAGRRAAQAAGRAELEARRGPPAT